MGQAYGAGSWGRLMWLARGQAHGAGSWVKLMGQDYGAGLWGRLMGQAHGLQSRGHWVRYMDVRCHHNGDARTIGLCRGLLFVRPLVSWIRPV